MITDLVNDALAKSMKQADSMLVKHRNFLRLIKGELQMAEVRQNKPLTDEQQAGVLKKILKSNEETIDTLANQYEVSGGADPRVLPLIEENNLIRGFLPKEATPEEIIAALASVTEQIKNAKNDGQATGVAMKTLKEVKLVVDGNIVKDIVAGLRNG